MHRISRSKIISLATAIMAITTVGAQAAIVQFAGQDNGAAIGTDPISAATQTFFLSPAGVFGTVNTHDLETHPVGDSVNNTFFNRDGTFSLPDTDRAVAISLIRIITLGYRSCFHWEGSRTCL